MANKYIEQMHKAAQQGFDWGMEMGFQQAMDFMCMALNDPDCMGAKGVLGGDKIKKIADYTLYLDHAYRLAFNAKHPEADVWQERLDAKQKKIFKDDFQPMYTRYPNLKKCSYEVKKRYR